VFRPVEQAVEKLGKPGYFWGVTVNRSTFIHTGIWSVLGYTRSMLSSIPTLSTANFSRFLSVNNRLYPLSTQPIITIILNKNRGNI
jgi:hypothetical protein